jgi:HdeA/HdeB family
MVCGSRPCGRSQAGFVTRYFVVIPVEGTMMRCRLITLAFAISIVPAVANAAPTTTIDIGKITCSQYLAMPPALSSKFSAWMSGWFSYRNRRTFVDFDLHQANIAKVKAWCQSSPDESVMAGLLKAIGSTAPAGAKLDFNKITCGDWLGYAPEDRDSVRYFMSGYYSSAASDDVFDYDRLQRNSRKVVAYCEKKKLDTLPTAIHKRAS